MNDPKHSKPTDTYVGISTNKNRNAITKPIIVMAISATLIKISGRIMFIYFDTDIIIEMIKTQVS